MKRKQKVEAGIMHFITQEHEDLAEAAELSPSSIVRQSITSHSQVAYR